MLLYIKHKQRIIKKIISVLLLTVNVDVHGRKMFDFCLFCLFSLYYNHSKTFIEKQCIFAAKLALY